MRLLARLETKQKSVAIRHLLFRQSPYRSLYLLTHLPYLLSLGSIRLRDNVLDHLRQGRVLAYPTETVYGFGAVCTPEGVDGVRALKGRSEDKPLLVLLPKAEHAAGLAWTDEARELGEVFWPGAVTLVLSDPAGIFPAGIRSSAGTVAVRVSPHPLVRAILSRLDEPITSTSANAG